MTSSLLDNVTRVRDLTGLARKEAERLRDEPGGTPSWPIEAVAEADELVELLQDAERVVAKLYAVTPPQWKIEEATTASYPAWPYRG